MVSTKASAGQAVAVATEPEARAAADGSLLGADIRSVIARLEEHGELRQIDGADWNLELGAITEMLALRDGPALLFDNIKGHKPGYRVLTNLLNSTRRVALLMGLSRQVRGVELVRAIKERFNSVKLVDPVEVKSAAFQEQSHQGDEINMLEFPSPFWHEHDGGRYLGTACAVITRDPDTGWVNVGTYRIQVHDKRTLGTFVEPSHHAALIRQRYWERGEACPMAVCTGVQTGMLLGSFLRSPWGVSELAWAGGLIGEPVEVFTGAATGLPIPASSEIVIEGFCPPPTEETRLEGPFGETIGYYASGAREEPVLRVERVYHRQEPIVVGAPPLRPPTSSSSSYLFRAANLWTELDRSGLPDIRGVWVNPSGSSFLLTVVSLKQRYNGHAKQVAHAVLGQRSSGRFLIIVDEDIDPSDTAQVLWAVSTRCDPETSMDIVPDCASDYLDPRLPPDKREAGDYTSSRAVIYACKPFSWIKQFPREIGTSPELQARILKDWPDLFQ